MFDVCLGEQRFKKKGNVRSSRKIPDYLPCLCYAKKKRDRIRAVEWGDAGDKYQLGSRLVYIDTLFSSSVEKHLPFDICTMKQPLHDHIPRYPHSRCKAPPIVFLAQMEGERERAREARERQQVMSP